VDPTRIPHTLHVQTIRPVDAGNWTYRVEYLELDGCRVEDRDLLTALSRLDAIRESTSSTPHPSTPGAGTDVTT
jgi:hypothetical protein